MATIDCLRGLAALWVVLFHVNEIHPRLTDPYHAVAGHGWLGVSVFFVVSGYCIANARERDGVISFWLRRLLRILPPLWASLLVISVTALTVKLLTGTNDVARFPRDAVEWVYTVCGLTEPASNVPAMNWVNWSLAYELFFYIAVGLLYVRGSFLPVLILSGVLCAFPIGSFPFDYWHLFALGIGVHLITRRQWFAGGLLVAICAMAGMTRGTPAQWLAAAVAGAAILLAPTFFAHRFLRPIHQFGTISYSLYLLHVPIGVYIGARMVDPLFGRTFSESLVRDGLLVFICVAASAVFYRLAEKPAHEFARRACRSDQPLHAQAVRGATGSRHPARAPSGCA